MNATETTCKWRQIEFGSQPKFGAGHKLDRTPIARRRPHEQGWTIPSWTWRVVLPHLVQGSTSGDQVDKKRVLLLRSAVCFFAAIGSPVLPDLRVAIMARTIAFGY